MVDNCITDRVLHPVVGVGVALRRGTVNLFLFIKKKWHDEEFEHTAKIPPPF